MSEVTGHERLAEQVRMIGAHKLMVWVKVADVREVLDELDRLKGIERQRVERAALAALEDEKRQRKLFEGKR